MPSVEPDSEQASFEWELCRENVQPLRGGRRVEAINQALAHVAPKAETVVNEKFSSVMAECECSEDPLQLCLQFCTWFDETFPIGRQRLFYQQLWKIINRYAKEDRYLDDERMLKVWIKLADNSLGHGWEIYQHANTIGSLKQCPQLYIRWAEDLELRGSISDARAVLHRGKLSGADHEALTNEEDELELREMRRELDRQKEHASSDDDDDDEWTTDENGHRVALRRIAPVGETPVAPVVRLPSIVGEQGSSRLNRGEGASRQQRANAAAFEVFCDDAAPAGEENHLESLYDMYMDNHIDRLVLSEENREQLIHNKLPIKKVSTAHPTFSVYSDDKENKDPNAGDVQAVSKKPRLMLCKTLISEMSMEENLAQLWAQGKLAEADNVKRRLTFDDGEEED